MAYLVCQKNCDNLQGTLHKIAEDDNNLNYFNINKTTYKIINISLSDFNDIRLNKKNFVKYNSDEVFYENNQFEFLKETLNDYIKNVQKSIKDFLDNNPNHQLFNLWNNYYNQLNNLDLNSITYPLNKSLEQYFNDLGQTALNPLQIP